MIHFYTVFFSFRQLANKLRLWWNVLYFGGSSAKTIHPSSKLSYKNPGMSASTEMIPVAQNCAVWAACWWQAPHPKYRFQGQFFCGLQNPYAEIWKLLTALAKIRSKSVQDKCLKGHTVLVTKNKTHFSVILHNPWVPPLLHEYTLWSHTYIPGFIQICSGLGEL